MYARSSSVGRRSPEVKLVVPPLRNQTKLGSSCRNAVLPGGRLSITASDAKSVISFRSIAPLARLSTSALSKSKASIGEQRL